VSQFFSSVSTCLLWSEMHQQFYLFPSRRQPRCENGGLTLKCSSHNVRNACSFVTFVDSGNPVITMLHFLLDSADNVLCISMAMSVFDMTLSLLACTDLLVFSSFCCRQSTVAIESQSFSFTSVNAICKT